MDIKTMRLAAGMSQEALAQASSVSRISIARYESGQREPTLTIAAKLAAALDCSVDDLVERKEDNHGSEQSL